jgi:amidase/aspartyl-tRNA(Asn)/glutamyl-tRNA(Gln) amidotransferase subunit A
VSTSATATKAAIGADATSLVQQMRAHKLSAREAVSAAIERIEAFNPAVNAVVTPTFELAMSAAEQADRSAARGEWLGPLHGVPILIKDLFDFRAGIRNTFGCRALSRFVPDQTVAHVERLEGAGAIILGKTNVPEFGHKGTTDNKLFGPTSCPFDLSRNAGGSSGGSAAAVAVGMVPLAQGSDAGGSIRIPAAWCGVVGLKLSYGRVPNTGSPNAFFSHTPFVHAGPLTRTVRDAALMAQVMCGPHDDDPLSMPNDGMNLIAALDDDAGSLRLAYSRDLGVFAVEPAVAQVVDECVADLRSAGLQIDEVDVKLPLDQDELAALWCREVGAMYLEMFDSTARGGLDLLRDFADDIPMPVHEMVDSARRASALDLRRDDALRSGVWREIQSIFQSYQGLLTPTLGALPVPNGADGSTLGPATVNGRPVERCIGWCLTHPFNFTGHPAASVPAGQTPEGLPVGLQVVGGRFRDEHVISICSFVEQARPWLPALERLVPTLRVGTQAPDAPRRFTGMADGNGQVPQSGDVTRSHAERGSELFKRKSEVHT